MPSYRRIAVTTATVAALAAPAAAQARPDTQPTSQAKVDNVSPDARYGVPEPAEPVVDKVSPDARYGVPDASTPTIVTVPKTEVVEADDFVWGDALIGAGTVLVLTAVVGGAAIAIRPRQSAAH